ncbi:MAG: Peptidase-M23 domain-containing protein [Succiniclasticum sp.]|jgi:murein DD-endopeptidase MepM/ murein hydrolase activator NlpD
MEQERNRETTPEGQKAEPSFVLMIPGKNGRNRVWTLARRRVQVLAAVCVAVVGVLAGTAGYFGYQYFRNPIDRAGYEQYLAHKKEQDARLQSLLADNEKMLRDMSEIHTLETKLRRAVIRSDGNRDFSESLDKVNGQTGVTSSDPAYTGKGGPVAGTDMLDVVAAQDKNLQAQIHDQKLKMNQLLSIMEKRYDSGSSLPDLWPTEGGTISSYYGARLNPMSGIGQDWHPGLDIAVDYGTPVYAAAAGTVDTAGWVSGYGRYVRIQHERGYTSAYGHMSGIAVAAGQHVRKGEIIGFVGSTGYSTGPHLHFEVQVDGQTVDPLYMLGKAQ